MRKGFTLVELLAVIVILSIIAVITIPMIKGVIDKVKLGSLEDSVYGLKSAAELYFSSNEKMETTEFICSDNGCISNTGKKLDYKGKVEGKIKLFSDGKVSICLTDDNYASSILANEKKATSKMGGCDEETYEISEVIAIEKYNEIKSGVDLLKNSLYNKEIISSKENTFEQMASEVDNLDLNQGEAENKRTIVDGLKYSNLGITEEMSWSEIKEKLLQKFPEWDGYLYKNGSIRNDIVGEWLVNQASNTSISFASSTINFSGVNTVSASAISSYIVTDQSVDLTNKDFTNLNIEWSGSSQNKSYMHIWLDIQILDNQNNILQSANILHTSDQASNTNSYNYPKQVYTLTLNKFSKPVKIKIIWSITNLNTSYKSYLYRVWFS